MKKHLALAFFGIFSIVSILYGFIQREEADKQRNEAQRQESRAIKSEKLANEAMKMAEMAQMEAENQRHLAMMNEQIAKKQAEDCLQARKVRKK